MIAVRPDAGLDQFAEGAVRGGVIIESDIPQIPGLLGVIVRLGEARRNEIRSQPTRRAECRAYPAERGLTQEPLADISGFSQQYISGLEQGRRNPTVVTLYELATALGVNHLDLLRPTQEE